MAHKILIVDDEVHSLRILGLALHQEGYEVMGAQSGPEALEKIQQDRPDLVILDVMMPEMDGYEVCRRIRAAPDTAQTPVILLTALSEVDARVAGFTVGANDYVIKPVSFRELNARIKAQLARVSPAATTAPPAFQARILAFVGVKGGVGTTTLAINVALALIEKGLSTIVVDLRPQGGAVASQLGLQARMTLDAILERNPSAIDSELIESCLLAERTGLRVLPAVLGPTVQPHELTVAHTEKVIFHLAGMADRLILDLEPAITPATQTALRRATRIILVSEPDNVAIKITGKWLAVLEQMGIGGARLGIVVVNRSNPATSYTRTQLEEALQSELLALITPAPEMCLYANKTGSPILLQQRGTLIETQIRELAQRLSQ
jgi:CheY-like chemotaxis protein